MPCKKCEEGYKWGETGECKYDTLESCESANSKYNKMQPTPLGKKTYEEYAKELKEFNLSKVEKVELGLIDDINGMFKDTDKEVSKAEGSWTNVLNSAKKVNDAYNKVVERADKTLKAIDLAENQLKELGVKMPSELKGQKKIVENHIINAYDNIKNAKQINKFIN
jgi:hypothetical protein